MESSIKKLNKQQKEAVEHVDGPLLIIAGAGTGKTTVITERIKYLVGNEHAKPSQILALTFTEKAAGEMEERVDIAMPFGYTDMWISTFHSFCDQILRESAFHIGLDANYRLMTQAESVYFIRHHLFDFKLKYFRPLGNPTKFIYGMLTHFSRLQDEDISPNEYISWVKKQNKNNKKTNEQELEDQKLKELAGAYKKYNDFKVKESRMDFGDLITKTLLLFNKRPNVLKEYKEKFKYILIDEFQDTNYAQNELAILLAGEKADIAVVADDDQSIYRFRGAAISNILNFRKKYPKSKLISLTINYRSFQEILDASYTLIQFNNPDRLEVAENIDKKLKSERGIGGKVTFFHETSEEKEADRVAYEINHLIDEKEYSFGDIAILVRANNHADSFKRAFERTNIPFLFLGPEKLFLQPEIIDLISYLKVLYNFEDSMSLSRVLASEEFNVPAKDLIKLGNSMRKTQLTLYQTLKDVGKILEDNHSIETINKLVSLIDKHIEDQKKVSAGMILYDFLGKMDLLKVLLNPDTPGAHIKTENISRFFDKLKSFETQNKGGSVTQVVDWIDLLTELGDSPIAGEVDWSESDTVKIFTIHSAKGLEFPVVFLVNLVSERFPSRKRSEQIPVSDDLIKEVLPEGDFHLEEERRLFYVGMTRARDLLYLTAADFYGDGKRKKKLSPFIFEALGEGAASSEREDIKQLSFLDYQPKKESNKLSASSAELFHLDYLSYSQIQTFQICPMHYKLKYILKVPTPPTSSQSFGISMHETMKSIYMALGSGVKINIKYAINLLSKNWINEGYRSKKHMEKSFNVASEYIKIYMEKEFSFNKAPILVEKPFVIPVDKDDERLKIGGKIDRVDILPDGTIEIIDYKTGENIPDQKELDKDKQLSFYALAASKINEEPFGKNLKNITLSLYYFEGNKKISTKRTKEDLDNLVDEIFEIKKEIENSDFKCSGHPFCQNCEYSLYCRSVAS